MRAYNRKRNPKHCITVRYKMHIDNTKDYLCWMIELPKNLYSKRRSITDSTPTGTNINFSLKYKNCKDC